MKMILIITLTIFLSSCRGLPPKIETRPRCGLFLQHEGHIDGKLVFSGKCRCRNYEWTRDRIGGVGESFDVGLEQCKGLVGWTPDEWQGLYLDFDEFRNWLNDQD